jgi:hypothetical protein
VLTPLVRLSIPRFHLNNKCVRIKVLSFCPSSPGIGNGRLLLGVAEQAKRQTLGIGVLAMADETQRNDPVKEIFDELFSVLESLETQNVAILQFLKEQGMASDEKLAPYLDRAGNAASVKWRAHRARMEHLFSPIPAAVQEIKKEREPGKKEEENQRHGERSDGKKEKDSGAGQNQELDASNPMTGGVPRQQDASAEGKTSKDPEAGEGATSEAAGREAGSGAEPPSAKGANVSKTDASRSDESQQHHDDEEKAESAKR